MNVSKYTYSVIVLKERNGRLKYQLGLQAKPNNACPTLPSRNTMVSWLRRYQLH